MTCEFCGGMGLWHRYDQTLNNMFLTYFKALRDDCIDKCNNHNYEHNCNTRKGFLTVDYGQVKDYFKVLFKTMNIHQDATILEHLISNVQEKRDTDSKFGKQLSKCKLSRELEMLTKVLSDELVKKIQTEKEQYKDKYAGFKEQANKFASENFRLIKENTALKEQLEAYKRLADKAIKKIKQCGVDTANIVKGKIVFNEGCEGIIGRNSNNLQNKNMNIQNKPRRNDAKNFVKKSNNKESAYNNNRNIISTNINNYD